MTGVMTQQERERFDSEVLRSDRVLSARATAHFAELGLRQATAEVDAAEFELAERIKGESK